MEDFGISRFFIAMLAVILTTACMILYRFVEEVRLRSALSKGARVTELLCRGHCLDMVAYLRLCHQPPRPHVEVNDGLHYVALLGKKAQTRVTLRATASGRYVLERVEHYYSKNWQFTGWYTDYELKDGEPSRDAVFTMASSESSVAAGKRLPSFMMTEKGAECLCADLLKH